MNTLASTIVSHVVLPATGSRITITEETLKELGYPGTCLRELRRPLARLLPHCDVYAITTFFHETYPETPETVITIDWINRSKTDISGPYGLNIHDNAS